MKNASLELTIDMTLAVSHFQNEDIKSFFEKWLINLPAKDIRAGAIAHMGGKFSNDLVKDKRSN